MEESRKGREGTFREQGTQEKTIPLRIRTGDYRIQFRLEGQAVIVEKIGHRDGFYED